MIEQLTKIIWGVDTKIKFTLLEVGALEIESQREPFYKLLTLFPGSRIIGFEVEEAVCAEMNDKAPEGVHYYPLALGEKGEKRPFFITQHPMCCSLYEPNEDLIGLYHNFDVAKLKQKIEVDTISLDYFVKEHEIGELDFIKIDIQGAELDVFRGGVIALKDVLAIVCEVEFIPHYLNQPLFGDVCSFLSEHNYMFHKFLGIAGRALKPTILNNDLNYASQHIWSDAVYTHHPQKMEHLTDQQLLKLSVLTCIYGSPDMSYFCLAKYDERKDTSLANTFLKSIQVN